MNRWPQLAAAGAAAFLLASCASSAPAHEPDWRPQPTYGAVSTPPAAPTPTDPPGPAGPAFPAPSTHADPAVVATGLITPTALVMMPDNTALVGERTTGKILSIRPGANQSVTTIRTLANLGTTGGGGLLDLALSPTYSQDRLIFAYISTPTDNRVITFTLTGPATPVLTGIPRGPSDNAGRILFGPDGYLYIATGDAGDRALAAQPASLAGKMLRITDIGNPAPGNPAAKSPVYSTGSNVTNGLCSDPSQPQILSVGGDIVRQVRAGTAPAKALATVPRAQSGAGGCAILNEVLYVTSLSGESLLAASITTTEGLVTVGKFSTILTKTYGRLLTVAAASDGALWLTTANRDGHGVATPEDERVVRIVPSSSGASV